jgi:hypothetical protein
VRYEFDQDLAPAVDYQAVQRRLFLVFEQLVARLMYAALSPAEQFDRVSVCVSQQEPASDLDNGGVVGLAHGRGVQTVQRHGRAGAGVVLRFGLSQAQIVIAWGALPLQWHVRSSVAVGVAVGVVVVMAKAVAEV